MMINYDTDIFIRPKVFTIFILTMSLGVRESILHGFEFKKVEVLWKCICKILFITKYMFKTGHPTYSIAIWKMLRI